VRAGDQCAHEQSSLYRLIAGAQLTLRLGVAAGAALERGGGGYLKLWWRHCCAVRVAEHRKVDSIIAASDDNPSLL